MGEAENPQRMRGRVSVEDIRTLKGAATPHFALQIRNRIAKLIMDLPADDPARVEGERELRRLTRLGFTGQVEGHKHEDGIDPLPSLGADAEAEDAGTDAPTTHGTGVSARRGPTGR